MKNLDIANSLITHFRNDYYKKFGEKPIVNRGKIKYGLAEILQDYTQTEVKVLIDFYLATQKEPDLSDFCRRYDEIIRDKNREDSDKIERKQLLNETKSSVMKFREQFRSAK